MRGLAEIAGFGAAALALHAGALSLWPLDPVSPGEGEAVAVAVAGAEVAAIAASWRTAPDVTEAAEPVAMPSADDAPPMPASDAAPDTPPGPDAPDPGAPETGAAPVEPLPRIASPSPDAPRLAGSPRPDPIASALVEMADVRRPLAPRAPQPSAADGAPMPVRNDLPPPPLAPIRSAALSPRPAPAMEAGAGSFVGPARDEVTRMRATSAPSSPAPDAVPVVAAEPPGSPFAPWASLRPEAMPERPAPVRTASTVPARIAVAPPGARTPAAAPSRSAGASGSATKAAAPAGPPAETLQARWGAEVKGHIAGRAAAPRGVSGRVGLMVSVSTDGRIAGVGVARSSGDPRADRAAAGAVQRVGRVPRAPGGLPPGTYRFAVALTLR